MFGARVLAMTMGKTLHILVREEVEGLDSFNSRGVRHRTHNEGTFEHDKGHKCAISPTVYIGFPSISECLDGRNHAIAIG